MPKLNVAEVPEAGLETMAVVLSAPSFCGSGAPSVTAFSVKLKFVLSKAPSASDQPLNSLVNLTSVLAASASGTTVPYVLVMVGLAPSVASALSVPSPWSFTFTVTVFGVVS